MTRTDSDWEGLVVFIRRLLVRPHHDLQEALWFWGFLAGASLVAGLLIAGNPGRSDAFFEVREWLSIWRNGANIYELPLAVDYPPHAIVFLSPMLLLPTEHGELFFAAFNVVVCAATAWTIVSLTSGYAAVPLTRIERLAYALMLVVWSPTRVGIWNGQTSPFLILCCCLALRLSVWSPYAAGFLLAVGCSKPHVAFGFVMLAAFCRLWKVVFSAAFFVAAALFAYSISVHRSLVDVIQQYIHNLFSIYGGPMFLRAEIDLRPFFTDLISSYNVGESLYLFSAAAAFICLLWFAWRGRHNPDTGVWLMAACLMWSLAVFPSRRYGMLLIAPTILLLLWSPGLNARWLNILSALIFLIAADLPFIARHLIMSYGSASAVQYAPYLHYVHRFVVIGCLAISFGMLARVSRSKLSASAV